MPLATTENEAFWPVTTAWLCGSAVIPGGTMTASVATALVAAPQELVTITV